jgi:hypothetical protein
MGSSHAWSSVLILSPFSSSLSLPSGVAEIKALQHLHTPLQLSQEQQNELKTLNRRKMSSLHTFCSLPNNKPYALISLSEFGIPKKWNWRGLPLDDQSDLGIDPSGSLTADFQNLFSALESETSLHEQATPQHISQFPSGASQERVSNILQWVLPPLTSFYNTRVGVLKPALSNFQTNPLLAKSRGTARGGGGGGGVGGGDETFRPLTADAVMKRRTSVSELIWTNPFLHQQQQQQQLNPTNDNEIDSVSSGYTFISNGLEKSRVVQEITEEEYNDEEMGKIRQNAQMAGICESLASHLSSSLPAGNDLNIFVREIASIKKKVRTLSVSLCLSLSLSVSLSLSHLPLTMTNTEIRIVRWII